jgi:stringent starvation protein B
VSEPIVSESSTKPYLIRAIHEWCSDNGYTPYVSVAVDEKTVVPKAYVKAGEIVLNVSTVATNRLKISNDLIEFQARFGGVGYELSIPISNVSAIYARETGHGMAFDVVKPLALIPSKDDQGTKSDDPIPLFGPKSISPKPPTLTDVSSGSQSHASGSGAVSDDTSSAANRSGPALRPVPLGAGLDAVDGGAKNTTGATAGPDSGDDDPKPTRPKLTRIK